MKTVKIMAKEKLIDIVENINECEIARRGTNIFPISRIHCVYDGLPQTFWLTNSIVKYYRYDNLKEFGSFQPKNSNVAVKMQTMEVGSTYEYDQKNKIKRMQHHCVVLENRSDFQNQTIVIAGDPLIYQYRNISDFLSALYQNRKEIEDIENRIAYLQNLLSDSGKQENKKQRQRCRY